MMHPPKKNKKKKRCCSFRHHGCLLHFKGLTEEYVNGDTTPHYHKSTDTYATVNFAYLADVTAVVSEAFKGIATAQA